MKVPRRGRNAMQPTASNIESIGPFHRTADLDLGRLDDASLAPVRQVPRRRRTRSVGRATRPGRPDVPRDLENLSANGSYSGLTFMSSALDAYTFLHHVPRSWRCSSCGNGGLLHSSVRHRCFRCGATVCDNCIEHLVCPKCARVFARELGLDAWGEG